MEIVESIDYGESDYRYEMEGEPGAYDREEKSLGSMGYQKQEFDDAGELISTDEDEEEEAFEDDFDEEFEESLDV